MKNTKPTFLNKLWSPITYRFDRLASGSILKQFLALVTVFLALYLFWLLIFTFCVSGYDKKINNEIPSRHWSIISQMIDPGNQHMIGVDTVSVNILPIESGKVVVDTTSKKMPTTIVKTVKLDNRLRWLVLLISISGTLVFSGLLISTFTNIFEQRVTIVRQGLMNYYYKNHLVIIGCNRIVVGLINQLIAKPEYNKSKIVILTSQNVPDVKQLLVSKFPATVISRIQILYGNRTSREDLNRLWLPLAKVVFVLGENNEFDHDSLNTACLGKMEEILQEYYSQGNICFKRNPQILDCNILFDSQTTYTAHQFLNFQKLDEEGKREDTLLNINVFSFYEKWTQKVFVGCKHLNIEYSPLDFEHIDYNSNKYVHVVVGGITRMGFAVGLQAARLGHFANFERKKTRITFIDSNAEREMNFFATRFQNFYDAVDVTFIDLLNGRSNTKKGTLPFIDVELTFINGHFESPEVREKLMTWTSDPDALTTIAICFNNPSVCLAAGLYLPNEIYSKKVRVIVQQETEHSILSSLHPDDSKVDNRYKNVQPFGMVDDCIDLNLHSDFKAKAVNYFYSSGNSLPKGFSQEIINTMDDYWKKLRERFKWSSRYNAESIPTKLRALNIDLSTNKNIEPYFTEENIELLAKMEHARWNVETLLAGYDAPSDEVLAESTRTANLAWEAYISGGKNIEDSNYLALRKAHNSYVNSYKKKMIHPCLVPYNMLSNYYKDVDRKLVKCIPIIEGEYTKHNGSNS